MTSVNEVKVSGGVVRAPDYAVTEHGYPVWKGTVASSGTIYDPQTRKDVVKVTYVRVTFGGLKASELHRLGVTKGDKLLVFGSIDNNEWVNKDTGKKESKTQVRGVSFDLLEVSGPSAVKPPEDDPWGPPPAHEEKK